MIAIRRRRDPSEVYRELLRENPDALVIVGFEDAYIGVAVGYPVAVYDYDECIYIYASAEGCDDEEATEFVDDVIKGCYFDDSPVFVRRSAA